jgi:hypothetical protein
MELNGESSNAAVLLSGDGARLAEAVINDYLGKSPGRSDDDATSLDECYALLAMHPDGTSVSYYAFSMGGRAYLQMGAEGQYSRVDNALYEKLAALVDSHATSAQADIDRTDLEAAVSNAILSENAGNFLPGDFSAEAHTVLGTEENGNLTTVYAMAMYMVFGYAGSGFFDTGGCHSPVAITFEINGVGEYVLQEYWTPGDGSHYGPSVKDKFPPDLYADVLDTQKYVTGHIQSCYAQAIEYGKVSADGYLQQVLETICSSPSLSSNFQDYIDANPIAYREMIYYGQYTLDYCFALFEKGGQTGLEGHIMASACRDIIGAAADVNVPVSNGQEWYNAYKESTRE